jgi:hypothetical protein
MHITPVSVCGVDCQEQVAANRTLFFRYLGHVATHREYGRNGRVRREVNRASVRVNACNQFV